jgi:integrase
LPSALSVLLPFILAAYKGAKDRVVPISERLAAGLRAWAAEIGEAEGYIARSINKGGRLGAQLGPIGLFRIVSRAGAAIGKPDLAPHSLRRTYAQLGYEAGIPITQISKLLGHSSVATTQRYLNLELNLEVTVGDFIPY